ncbi:MAG TPA: RNA polymerase sigma factor [Candidatus Paceibacterota bacterium]|jgi:RNA polymerase sigma-70 factor (ECF subfamily)
MQGITDLQQKPDEEILLLSLRHPSAFSVLVDRYQAAFLRKARTVLRNNEDAEDVVQETFTKIYLYAGKFEKQAGASFSSWGYKILMNTSFTHYQKRKRERSLRVEIDPKIFELFPDRNSREFEKESFADYVASVIVRMPDDLGRVLKLYFLQGLPQVQIAELEGATVGAIKTRVHRAKKVFRDISASIS